MIESESFAKEEQSQREACLLLESMFKWKVK
jgi:hypothetical protein